MDIVKYFASSSKILLEQSNIIKLGFSTHHLSSGQNRENLVGKFLEQYLPTRIDIDTGLLISNDGIFSNEADLLLTDRLYNAPLFPEAGKKLWYVEAVYSMIEVKTILNSAEIDDCINKCIKFKSLRRDYSNIPFPPNISDSLFIIWGFDGLEPYNMKQIIMEKIKDIEPQLQPDFIIVPDKYIVTLGTYRSLSYYGQKNSPYYLSTGKQNEINDRDTNKVLTFYHIKENALLSFIIWLTSWINAAGQRSAPLQSYLPKNYVFGEEI